MVSLVVLVGCRPGASVSRVDSASAVAALRDTLVRLGQQDQAERDSIGLAAARNDTQHLARLARADSGRTQWLQAHVAAHGWPRRSLVGDTAATAAWLIVQHSADTTFQARMLEVLEREAAAGEVRAADVAMLSDRLAVHGGGAQRHGTQFSLRNGTLVVDSIAALGPLDSLRATVGLPPMRDYVRMLAEVYHLPVEWPPRRP